jgi:hypothetical protein
MQRAVGISISQRRSAIIRAKAKAKAKAKEKEKAKGKEKEKEKAKEKEKEKEKKKKHSRSPRLIPVERLGRRTRIPNMGIGCAVAEKCLVRARERRFAAVAAEEASPVLPLGPAAAAGEAARAGRVGRQATAPRGAAGLVVAPACSESQRA